MIVTRAQKIRLGVFILVSVALLLGMLAVLVGGQLTEKEDHYTARFEETVSGLEVGATVKYHGVRIGSVTAIEIDREDVSQVIVSLSLQHGTPVKEDSVLMLNSMGITGLKFVELTGGTNESPFLEPGSEIPTGASLLDRLTGKADVITEKIELLINNMLAITGPRQQEQFNAILDEVRQLLETTNGLVARNEARIDQFLDDLTASTANLRELSEMAPDTLARLEGEMTLLVNDMDFLVLDLQGVVAAQNEQIAQLVQHVDETVVAAGDLVGSPEARRLPRRLNETVVATLKLVESSDRRIATLLSSLNESAGRIQGFLADERVDGMLSSFARLSTQAENLVDTLDLTMRQSREDLFKTLSNLKDVVRNLNDFTQMLLESPSILLRGSQLKERKQ